MQEMTDCGRMPLCDSDHFARHSALLGWGHRRAIPALHNPGDVYDQDQEDHDGRYRCSGADNCFFGDPESGLRRRSWRSRPRTWPSWPSRTWPPPSRARPSPSSSWPSPPRASPSPPPRSQLLEVDLSRPDQYLPPLLLNWRQEKKLARAKARASFLVSADVDRTLALFFTPQDHAAVMQHAVNEVAVSGKACVVPIVDVVAADLVAPLIGTLSVAPGLVVATVG